MNGKIPDEAVEAAADKLLEIAPRAAGEIPLWAILQALEAAAPYLMAPRTITTAEELDALPAGSVIRTSGDEDHFDPRVAAKTATLGKLSFWAVAGDEDGFESSSDELDDLPATVLYEPQP